LGTKAAPCALRQGVERGCKKKSRGRCGDGEGFVALQPPRAVGQARMMRVLVFGVMSWAGYGGIILFQSKLRFGW
jgi:hypothetical protein